MFSSDFGIYPPLFQFIPSFPISVIRGNQRQRVCPRPLVDGTLEEKVATKLAYVLQVAMSNVDFEPEEVEEEIR